MQAKDAMTPKIISVEPDATILRAIRLMLQNKISGLPVVDAAGNLVGIVTEGDFLRRAETGTVHRAPRWIEFLMGPGPLATEYVHSSGRKVHEVMTSEVRFVTENASLEEVANLMERYHIKRVPVLREKQIVGIITRANLVRALATAVRQAIRPVSTNDAEIRERLLALIKKQRWAPIGMIDIAVSNGVVTFTGALLDDRQREALHVAAENTPGVTGIDDRLVWIEPISGYVVEAPPH